MVVCRMTLMVCKKKRSKVEIGKKTKWWKLKKEECFEEFRLKFRQTLGGQVVLPDDWETTADVIRETGRKVLGVSSGRRKEDKEIGWWNEEVQDSIQRKRLAKKKWDMDRTEENRQEYKELQHRVKREVSKAKQKAYEELYTRLDTREGQKDLYSIGMVRGSCSVFDDLEKAYERVPREELWYYMRKSGVAEKYVRVVQDMRGDGQCESRGLVEENLERWTFALERRGMKVSRSKTEYMCVNEREGSGTVRLQGEEVKKLGFAGQLYADFEKVFSEERASRLPEHQEWDCAINLLPNTSLPKGRIYPLSLPESEAMEDYIEGALAAGHIRPSTSPAVAGFFFVEKKDGGSARVSTTRA
ncbi:hypothetical protein QTP70_024750 [Hemibagrus guttatus]|uniref:Reverse transcriptase n=1 Tax=Hemibagrus guttatus TaxID=175788 RepID=A0AAE0RK49_9TELE|nr:hypothetical protein QTP70_024750 [Hemibagrus guttatus]KAK3575022.1 hypothetical protein QTP86_019799 [Hemibagrus guttatus]